MKEDNVNPWNALKRMLGRKLVRASLEAFIASHSTDELTLDLGCGNSRYSSYFPNRVGFDLCNGKGVDVRGDAHHLPIKSLSFSVVLATEMLEHSKDPQRVVDEIEKIIKSGCKLILTTRFVFPIHDAPADFYRFTRYGLKHLFKNWEKVEIKSDTRPFESIGVLFQRMAFQSDFRGSKVVKGLCLLAAQILRFCDVLVRKQYGDYERSVLENEIITSGYHVVAIKASNDKVKK